MKVCQKCKLIGKETQNFCPQCNRKLSQSEKTDNFLKKFLEVDGKILKRFREIRQETIIQARELDKIKGKIRALGISGSARDEFDMASESSNSEFLLQAALDELKKMGAETELIALRKYDIRPCKACYSTTNAQCHFYCSCYPRGTDRADDMSNVLYDKIIGVDIIIFATPVNNFKISSFMALFLDRCISLDGSLSPADSKAPKNKELNIKHTKFIELMADEKVPGSGFLRRFAGKTGGIIVTGHEEGAALVISSLFMTLSHFGVLFAPWTNMYAMASITNPTYKDKKITTGLMYSKEARQVARNAMSAAVMCRKNKKSNWQYDNSAN